MATYNNVYKALEGEIMVETAKAILFRVVDKTTGSTIKQDWFPKSQLASFGGTYDEIEGTFQFILASEWILGQKGLLSIAMDRKEIAESIGLDAHRKAAADPNFGAKYTGTTKQDKANRLPYKDDEDSVDATSSSEDWDSYFDNLHKTGLGDD